MPWTGSTRNDDDGIFLQTSGSHAISLTWIRCNTGDLYRAWTAGTDPTERDRIAREIEEQFDATEPPARQTWTDLSTASDQHRVIHNQRAAESGRRVSQAMGAAIGRPNPTGGSNAERRRGR